MNLHALADALRDAPGIKKKFLLHDVLDVITSAKVSKDRVFKDIGEDAAAITIEDRLILIASDMISPGFIERNPFAAGYSAILVSIDDIYASGGNPLAATAGIQAHDDQQLKEILAGLARASEQFNIPIARGHTTIQAGKPAISTTIIGEIEKHRHVSAGNARNGDALILIWDPSGKKSPNGPYWDTVTGKSKDETLARRSVLQCLAKEGYLHACKDISDSGLVGTVYMMLNYSRVGGVINVWKVKDAFRTTEPELFWWLTAYISTGFIASVPMENINRIEEICAEKDMEARLIGSVEEGSCLELAGSGERVIVLDWQDDPIFPESVNEDALK